MTQESTDSLYGLGEIAWGTVERSVCSSKRLHFKLGEDSLNQRFYAWGHHLSELLLVGVVCGGVLAHLIARTSHQYP